MKRRPLTHTEAVRFGKIGGLHRRGPAAMRQEAELIERRLAELTGRRPL